MMYEVLASYYDALVKDETATKAWVKLIDEKCAWQKDPGSCVRQRRDHDRISQRGISDQSF